LIVKKNIYAQFLRCGRAGQIDSFACRSMEIMGLFGNQGVNANAWKSIPWD
jgi:hypothetical protein